MTVYDVERRSLGGPCPICIFRNNCFSGSVLKESRIGTVRPLYTNSFFSVYVMSRNKNKNKNKKRKQNSRTMSMRTGPPTIKMQPVFSRKIQFYLQTGNTTNQVITVNQLAQMCVGFMALTATTSGFFTNQFRIKVVSLWSPPPAAGSSTQCSLKFADTVVSGLAAPSTQVGDSSMEPDRPAKCKIRPPPGTVYDWFLGVTSTNNYLVITAPLGSICQISFEHYLDNSGTISAGPTIVGANPGVIYNKTLTFSTQVWTPHSSINTI